jgi:hypothetical protein
MALDTYGRVFDEFAYAERLPAEALICAARDELVPLTYPGRSTPSRHGLKSGANGESRRPDSHRGPRESLPQRGRDRFDVVLMKKLAERRTRADFAVVAMRSRGDSPAPTSPARGDERLGRHELPPDPILTVLSLRLPGS